jgi:alanyl-tRNA synthetase
MEVEDTQKLGELLVHIGRAEGALPAVGAQLVARVDTERRDRTRKNHTATHLMHKALKQVLGDHVNQQGSYVGPDRLRFDFSHPSGVKPEELVQIEAIVNGQVFANGQVTTTVEELDQAKARGVVALFGEKYDERVRVVDVDRWSTELCGGTHVHAAGDIGPFVIVSESAIQAGVRRIEALTGPAAVEHVQNQRRVLQQLSHTLKAAPEELPERVKALQAQVKEAKKKQKAGSKADVGSAFEQLKQALAERGGVSTAVLDVPEVGGAALGELGDRAKSLGPDHALALFTREGDKVPFLVLVGGRALEQGLKAGALAKTVAGILGGGGGGRPDRAQGQGLQAGAVADASKAVEEAISAAL